MHSAMVENSALAEASFSGSRFPKQQRTRERQEVVVDLVARQRGRETIGRENIWEFGDALRSGEKVSPKAGGGGRSSRV